MRLEYLIAKCNKRTAPQKAVGWLDGKRTHWEVCRSIKLGRVHKMPVTHGLEEPKQT